MKLLTKKHILLLHQALIEEFGGTTGLRDACFETIEKYTKERGAKYYEINSEKEDSVRFWKSLGFEDNGKDEWGMNLLIKK